MEPDCEWYDRAFECPRALERDLGGRDSPEAGVGGRGCGGLIGLECFEVEMVEFTREEVDLLKGFFNIG